MVKITFLGACQEVGRSGVLIESEETGDAILCDYGTKMKADQQNFPAHVSGKSLTAIVLSHAHIDHSGGLPIFYISGSVPLFATELTFKTTEILLMDMLNITEVYLPFEKPEVDKMKKFFQPLDYGQKRKVGKKTWITLINAGHIPGSAMVLVEMDGKRILYTGDFNTSPTQLVKPANPSEIPELDAIVMEATYGTQNHPPRKTIEDEFLTDVKKIIDQKGVVLVPAFGVSRSQEIMMVLSRDGAPSFPIIVDGMARKIALLYERYPAMLRDCAALITARNNTRFITQRKSSTERTEATASPTVVIAPSGMLKGGTSRIYAEQILEDEKSGIFLVSYQIEDTPGRVLLDRMEYMLEDLPDKTIPVKAMSKQFDFSSHAGMDELITYLGGIKWTSDQKRVFLVHSDPAVITAFAENIRNRGYLAEAPVESQSFKV
jgi:putative mRNA 3-end processing factor